jgi:hypothetical protein
MTIETFNYRSKVFILASLRDGELLYVLPEYEVRGMSRPEWNEQNGDLGASNQFGLPATVKFYNTARVPLSSDEQSYDLPTYYLLLELFRRQRPEWKPEFLKRKLAGYLKDGVCYTDHTKGWAWNPITTCGNLLYPTGASKMLGGELHFEVLQLEIGTLNFMYYQLEKNPLLITWSTISTREYGGRGSIPFWHLDGVGVPAPLYCKSPTNWIRASRVRRVSQSEIPPSPYYP